MNTRFREDDTKTHTWLIPAKTASTCTPVDLLNVMQVRLRRVIRIYAVFFHFHTDLLL